MKRTNWNIHHKDVTGSTNADARVGEPGDVFTADFQTAGRGRLDHKWLSAPGENLMLSAVLDVAGLSPEHVATLPLAVGLAVLEGLSPFVRGLSPSNREGLSPSNRGGLSPWRGLSLKWPNDILFAERKLAGILCERHGDRVIAGVGVNVNQRVFAAEVADRAISLAQILGTDPKKICKNVSISCEKALLTRFLAGTVPVNAAGTVPVNTTGIVPVNTTGTVPVVKVRDAVLGALAAVYETWRREGFEAIYPRLAAVDFLRGQTLSVQRTDDDSAPACGLCGGIRPDGALDVGGEAIYAGEAHVRGPSGGGVFAGAAHVRGL